MHDLIAHVAAVAPSIHVALNVLGSTVHDGTGPCLISTCDGSDLVPNALTVSHVTTDASGFLGTAFVSGLLMLSMAFPFIRKMVRTGKGIAR